MKNKTILLIFILSFSFLAQGYGQEPDDENESFYLADRNPFKSWLPKIQEKIEKVIEGTKIDMVTKPMQVIPPPVIDDKKAEKKEEVKPPPLKVSGLVWSTKRPQAIINERVVSIGDVIEDSRIMDIHKDGVDILFSNKRFTIQIEQGITEAI